MKKITTILVVIILLCRIGAMAQELNVERIKPFIENSSIIIEGKTEYKRINQRLDKTRDYGTYYTLIRFKPTAIFKGTIDTSKFYEILVQRGSYLNDPGGDGEFTAPDKGCVFPPESGIYFFTKEIKPPDFYKPSNDAIFLEYSEGIYGINYKRTNRTNAFKFLEEKFSLKPVLIVAPLEEKKSPVQNEVIPFQKTQKIKNDTSSNIKNYKLSLEKEALINNIKIKHFKTNSNGSKSVQSDDIIFELANATRTGTGPYNLDFDILVQANTNSTYLDNAWIDISYNTLAFGSYVVTNGTINAYGVGLFNGPYFVYMTDAQPNVFELRLQTFPTGPWTRTQITSSFTDMIHVSIVISD